MVLGRGVTQSDGFQRISDEWRMDRTGPRMGPRVPVGLGEEGLGSGREWVMEVGGTAGIKIISGSFCL